MANYPNSATTFATRSAGQTIASAHLNAVQDEIAAIEAALLTSGLAHNVVPSGTRTIGTSSAFWDKVFGTALIVGAETTSGVRLDIETGTLAVREGDDSAYAPIKALTLETTTSATIGTTLGVTGVQTNGADLAFSGNFIIRRNTSDGSDNGEIAIAGGGAGGDTGRGAFIRVLGNEFSGNLGGLILQCGSASTAGTQIRDKNGNDAMTIGDTVVSAAINATTTAGGSVVRIESNVLKKDSSSLRFKRNLRYFDEDAAKGYRRILQLRPFLYQSVCQVDDPNTWYAGVGAEHVDPVLPEIVVKEGGVPVSVMYERAVPYLIAMVQEYEARLTALEAAA